MVIQHLTKALVAALIVVAASSSLSCSSDASPSTDGAAGSTGTAGGGSGGSHQAYGASACGACVQQQCASYLATCDADSGCGKYAQCVLACPTGADGGVDAACAAACPTGSDTASLTDEAGFDQCRTTGDGLTGCAACPQNPPTLPADSPINQHCSGTVSDCSSCQDAHECESIQKCESNPDCVSFTMCFDSCIASTDLNACELSCAAMFPNGTADFAVDYTATIYWCTDTCATSPVDPCKECSQTSNGACGVAYAAAADTADGLLLGACAEQCNDVTCGDNCALMYPSAVRANQEWVNCVEQSCPACAGG